MIPTSSTVLTYTYFSLEPYTEVPNISHVNNELYLTFKDTLKITANLYQDSSIVFNLPSINDHIFTSYYNWSNKYIYHRSSNIFGGSNISSLSSTRRIDSI